MVSLRSTLTAFARRASFVVLEMPHDQFIDLDGMVHC